MAEKRMMSKQIIDSDAFIDMPLSTQALYFHMLQRGDDDGFINNPKKIQRMIGCSEDDLRLLIAKNFIIPFDSGIVVIKHWRIHNYIKKDRYKETSYIEEKSMLDIKENGAYTLMDTNCIQNGDIMDTNCIQNGYIVDTQYRLDKNIDKNSIDKSNSKHKFGEYSNVLLTMEEYDKLKKDVPDTDTYIERLSEYIASKGAKYKSHYATIRSWYNRDKANKPKAETQQPSYEIEEFSEYKKPVYKSK